MEKRVIKSGIWYVIGEVLVRGMAFITTPIFTRVLTEEEYGNVANFNAWFAILSILSSMDLNSTMNRARFDFKNDVDTYISSQLILGNVVTITLFLFTVIWKQSMIHLLGIRWDSLLFLFICMFFMPAYDFFQICQTIRYDYKRSVRVNLIASVGGFLLAVGLITICSDKEFGLIIGMQLPKLVISVILYIQYMMKKIGLKLEFWKYSLKICLPFIPHLLSLNLLMNMDRIMIKRICGAGDAAMYSVAYSSAFAITILLNAINEAMSPWVGERLHEREYEEIRGVSRTYVLSFTVPALLFMLVVPEVMFILGGEKYLEAKYSLTPLVMSCICQFMYTMYVNVEQYEKQTVGMAIASVITAGVNGVLNRLLIPYFGYSAAAYTTMISYMLLLVLHMFLVRRMGMAKVYQNAFILMMLFVSLGTMFLVLYLYHISWYIRYILLIMGLIPAFLYMVKHVSIIRKQE